MVIILQICSPWIYDCYIRCYWPFHYRLDRIVCLYHPSVCLGWKSVNGIWCRCSATVLPPLSLQGISGHLSDSWHFQFCSIWSRWSLDIFRIWIYILYSSLQMHRLNDSQRGVHCLHSFKRRWSFWELMSCLNALSFWLAVWHTPSNKFSFCVLLLQNLNISGHIFHLLLYESVGFITK